MKLTEFLLARIVEDEARWQDFGHHDHNDYDPPAPWPQLLAECEAKRRIVKVWNLRMSEPWGDMPAMPLGGNGGEVYYEVIQCLATVYAGHPDFDEEWRP